MPKYAIRTATALALVVVMAVVAVSLLMAGAGGATAFNAGASDGAISIPAQYTAQCSNGVAVPNPASNAGLVEDCAALLAAKDTLEGARNAFNWSANVAISDWSGIDLGYGRVAILQVPYGKSLNGKIPAELGNLTGLSSLLLSDNQLTGEIPAELGNLTNLWSLLLDGNQLTGKIPSELGNLTELRDLYLQNNQLTGEIPSELGNLARLDSLRLENNRFTGCIPRSLRAVLSLGYRDIRGSIGLPICGDATAIPTSTATSAPTATPTSIATSTATATPVIVIEPTHTPTATPAIVIEPTPTATSASRPTAPVATPTPTATSAPRATATPTATPAATSTASNEVMSKLDKLGRQVAENPDLSRQVAEISDLVAAMSDLIATMAARIAELEGGDTGAPTATPTLTPTLTPTPAIVIEPTPTATPAIVIEPTPTATPAIAIEPTPTPTATATTTPSPTPTRVAAVEHPPAACVQSLGDNFTGSYSIGWWAPDCVSANPPRNLTYYARFYTFTLRSAAQATITLSSDDASPYLYLLNGAGTGGSIKREAGSATASAATISMSLQPGAYTIEATTWHSETIGDFTLQLEIVR